ncbi:MAG: aspartyl protease family protein [Planctomycetaceae bacterium]
MRFDGDWRFCDDGITRPVVPATVADGHGAWQAAEFLLDTGADRTLFSAHLLAALGLESQPSPDSVAGIGGKVNVVRVATRIQLTRDDGKTAAFRGEFAACTDLESLDMSVLGRDILDMFAVVVDRPGDIVAILGGNHRYAIHSA